jgi:hypothetical protein
MGRVSTLDGAEGLARDCRRSPPTLLRWLLLLVADVACLVFDMGLLTVTFDAVGGAAFSRPMRGIMDALPPAGRPVVGSGDLVLLAPFGSIDFRRFTAPRVVRRLLMVGRGIFFESSSVALRKLCSGASPEWRKTTIKFPFKL